MIKDIRVIYIDDYLKICTGNKRGGDGIQMFFYKQKRDDFGIPYWERAAPPMSTSLQSDIVDVIKHLAAMVKKAIDEGTN